MQDMMYYSTGVPSAQITMLHETYFPLNPSLLYLFSSDEVILAHLETPLGIRNEFISYIKKTNNFTIAPSVSFTYTQLDKINDEEIKEGRFNAYNGGVHLFTARDLKGILTGGKIGLNIISIYPYTKTALSFSFGFTKILRNFYTSMGISGLGKGELLFIPKLKVNTGYRKKGILVSTEFFYEKNFGIGGVIFYRFNQYLSVITGYSFLREIDSRLGTGIVVEKYPWSFKYSIMYSQELGVFHSLRLEAKIKKEKPEKELILLIEETSKSFEREGDIYFERKDYRNALFSYDKALIWNPENANAERKYEKVIKILKEESKKEHLTKARKFLKEKNIPEAFLEYSYLHKEYPTDSIIKREFLKVLEEIKNPLILGIKEEDVDKFEKMMEALAYKKFSEFFNILTYFKNKYSRMDIFKSIEELGKNKKEMFIKEMLLKAEKFEKQGAYLTALEILNKILEMEPSNAIALSKKENLTMFIEKRKRNLLEEAKNLWKENNYISAKEKFLEVLSLDPRNKEAKDYLKRIENILKIPEKDIEHLHIKAATSYAIGDYEKAIILWQEILKIDPNNKKAIEGIKRSQKKKKLFEIH